MPLLVLLMAVAIAYFTKQQASRRGVESVQFVKQSLNAACQGRDLRGKVNPDDSFIEQKILDQFQHVCPQLAGNVEPQFALVPADQLPQGLSRDSSTFAVMISIRGVDQLGVQVQYAGDPPIPRIVGYWLPQGAPNS